MVEGTRIKIVREEGRKTERGGRLIILGGNWFGSVRSFTTTLGQGGIFAVMIHNIVSDGRCIATGRLVKLGGGLQVWLLNWTGHGSGGGLVNTEGELHALDGTRSTVEASLAGAFFLSSTLLDHIGGMIPFESRSFEFDNAPE